MVSEIIGLQASAVKGIPLGSNQRTDQTGQHGNTTGAKENKSASPPSNDVKITDTALKLRQLEAKIASQPIVDTQKVENIKKAIADGTFRVNITRTAEKMAEFESLLASKVGDK